MVEGTVQGVAFRYHTRKAAERIGIRGTVKNLPDGKVEIYASSDPVSLNRFESFLRSSPGYSEVKKISKKEIEQEFQGLDFSIIY